MLEVTIPATAAVLGFAYILITMAQPSAVVESFQHSLSVNTENEYNVGQSEDENTPNENTESQARNGDSCLPPVDRGKDAWLFLAACYVIEAVTSGEFCPVSSSSYMSSTWMGPP